MDSPETHFYPPKVSSSQMAFWRPYAPFRLFEKILYYHFPRCLSTLLQGFFIAGPFDGKGLVFLGADIPNIAAEVMILLSHDYYRISFQTGTTKPSIIKDPFFFRSRPIPADFLLPKLLEKGIITSRGRFRALLQAFACRFGEMPQRP